MTFRSPCRTLVLLALVLAAAGATGLTAAQSTRAKPARRTRDVSAFRKERDERYARFVAALDELADTFEAKGQADAAATIREVAEPPDPSELRITSPPRAAQPPLASLSAEERAWQTPLRQLREKYAQDLYMLSRRTFNAGGGELAHTSYTYDLVHEAIRYDPDQLTARKVLGYVRQGDEWITSFEWTQRRDNRVWHDKFGWLPKDRVERYEGGERFFQNKWITAEEEARKRQEFPAAWEIPTEHYLVKTNHSLERGVQLAKKLEDYHAFFFQLMAGFFNDPDQVRKLFEPSRATPAAIPKKNVVHYYRNREEYLEALRRETDQRVDMTRGLYFPRTGIAFFFYDPDYQDDSTLYHEATHQLLSGSRPQIGEVGMTGNFWIIEGFACYMESFRRDGDRYSVGDPNNGRIQAARSHFITDRYYLAFRQFIRLGMLKYQQFPDAQLKMNYSQGAALTHFFMHYDDGRYRQALIEHLSQMYSPNKAVRESPEPLEEMIGIDAEEIDRQYTSYIRDVGRRARRETAVEIEGRRPGSSAGERSARAP